MDKFKLIVGKGFGKDHIDLHDGSLIEARSLDEVVKYAEDKYKLFNTAFYHMIVIEGQEEGLSEYLMTERKNEETGAIEEFDIIVKKITGDPRTDEITYI